MESTNSLSASFKDRMIIYFRRSFLNSIRHRIFLCIVIGAIVFTILDQVFSSALIFLIFMAYCYVSLYFLIEKPLHSLLELTRHGGFDATDMDIPIDGEDEFSRLARATRDMGRRMRGSILEAKEQNSEIDEIFAAIGEGVIIVNDETKVLKINNTVRRWIGWYSDFTDKTILEVLRNVQLSEKIQEMVKESLTSQHLPTHIIESLSLEGPEIKEVKAKIVALRQDKYKRKFIIFLFDLTDVKRTENVRKEFFANVSHELKTPISAIRGYAELVQDLPVVRQEANANSFLSIIIRNSEALTQLIDEMLIVAGLESGSVTLSIAPYHIHSGIKTIIENMAPKAAVAQVDVVEDIDDSIEDIMVDRQRFESVMVNLIDNAIKYNKPGGMVKVSVRATETEYMIYVEDTGIGIPEHERSRAFERFFRIDKSHNRLGGGSGLGLAIAKHVVLAHGGSISLRSDLGVGSVFTIVLPKNPPRKKIDLLTPLSI